MRTLMVGLLAANGMMLGEADMLVAQAQGRSAVRVSYQRDASDRPDRYRSRDADGYVRDDRPSGNHEYDDRWQQERGDYRGDDGRYGYRPDDGYRNDDYRDDDLTYYDRSDRARRARTQRGVRITGPAFCVSGRGHPRLGWRWCVDRGHVRNVSVRPVYRVGPTVRWSVVHWGDVYFSHDYPRRAFRDPYDVKIKKVVGKHVRDRLRYHRDRLGLKGSLDGRWIRTGRYGLVLHVHARGVPVAELVDRNGDGHVDQVALSSYRY